MIIGIFETNLSLSFGFWKIPILSSQNATFLGAAKKVYKNNQFFSPGIFHVIISYHMGGEERIMIITECLFVECMACLIP